MANEVAPYFEPGGNFTGIAKVALTGKRLVKLDASVDPGWQPEGLKSDADWNVVPVTTCGAGEQAIGLAQRDVADEKPVTIMAVPGAIYPMVASAAITPGAVVQAAATGKVVTRTTGIAVGIAMSKTTADGQTVAVKFLPAVGTDLGQ